MSNRMKTKKPAPIKEPKARAEQIKEEKEVLKAIVFNCKKVRARKNPDSDEDNVITELAAGTEVELLDSSNPNWTYVDIDGTKAWIMSDYLQPV